MAGSVAMQVIEEHSSMWLYESITEVDLKINKALHKAKRSIMKYNAPRSNQQVDNVMINAAGQHAIAADLHSEEIFLKTLIGEGISGTMYSEESGVKHFGDPSVDDPLSIVCLLDPLDGSANYLKGIPFGCISIAYGAYLPDPVLKDLTTASVMSLYTDEEYFADRGYGSYKNGRLLQPAKSSQDYKDQMMQLSYYAYDSKSSSYYLDFHDNYSLRSLGSAAWELALVAENRNDAFVDLRGVLKTHDFAGARLILEEIGGSLRFLNIDQEESNYLPLDNFRAGYSVVGALDPHLLDYLLEELDHHDIAPSVSHK